MNILINNTTLNVNNAYPERDTQNGIITLFVTVPYSEMDYADLKALCKANTEDIIKNDGDKTEIYSGFSFASILDDEVNEVYTVKMTSDEYAFQLGRNRQLEADKAGLENTVSAKEMEISNLNSTISEKEATIAEREATIEAKDSMISEKNTVIEEKEVVITEQKETITELEATIISKDGEIAELLTIAEEYADMLYAAAMEEIEAMEEIDSEMMVETEPVESEVM